MTIGDIARRNAQLHPDKVGLKFEGRSYTYAEFNQRVNRLANGLLELGLSKGARVGLLERNRPELIEAYFAIAKSGAIAVPINPGSSKDELAFLMEDAGITALITGGDFIDGQGSWRNRWKQLEHVIVLGDRDSGQCISYEKLISGMPPDEPGATVAENDPWLIMYTSGTTGRPKGVVSSHRNHLANTATMVQELRIRHDDVSILVMPLYHIGGLWPTLVHFQQGGRVILQRKFDETAVLDAIQAERVTTFNLVPIMLIRLLEHERLRECDLRSLRLIFYGGAPMPVPVLRRALAHFGNRLMTGLGMTEASGGFLFLQPGDLCLEGPEGKVRRLNSVGRQAVNVLTRIVDAEGREIKPGEVGEVIVKGDNVMSGYWNLPDETAHAIRNGWLHTGDLATIDDEGYVFVVDRAKDIIISGGENISSREVEDALHAHPAVLEAAVIGIPDDRWGESVHAVVVRRRESELTEEMLIAHCREKLAGFKRPRTVEFMPELPRNSLGKVDKRVLKEKFWKERAGRIN
jgi:acyl-CoA synthetase (AMP-forming)/AMP-acid ligase II